MIKIGDKLKTKDGQNIVIEEIIKKDKQTFYKYRYFLFREKHLIIPKNDTTKNRSNLSENDKQSTRQDSDAEKNG